MSIVKKVLLIYTIIGIIILGAVLTYALCYQQVNIDDCVMLTDCIAESKYIGKPGHTVYILQNHRNVRINTLVKLECEQNINFYIPKRKYEIFLKSLNGGECTAIQIESQGVLLYTADDYNNKITKDRWLIVGVASVIIIVIGPLIIFSYFKTFSPNKINKNRKDIDSAEIK